ncbi:MAG: rhodanese-like domain-containing protein [Phyllobacteriaceae bacterium]|nr:rhodanese-like domain-containing protein [Phyllobacteriaceae bacterium]
MLRPVTAIAAPICAAFLALATPAFAAENMSPADAWARMQANTMVLVDVRQPSEWRSTGIAPGAVTLTMGAPGLYDRLQSLAAANPGKTIGLICAAGGRSTMAARELESRGLSRVVDVKAGMLGGMVASGWLDEGLPVQPWKDQ